MGTKARSFFMFAIILFVLYMWSIDPDNHILQNLPWGSSLLITLQIFVVALLAVTFVEVVLDGIQEKPIRYINELVEKAKETSTGAGLVLLYRGLVVLTYGIIMAASIIALNSN